MLIVPELIERSQLDGVTILSSVRGMPDTCVQCPLVGGMLIAEADCYDFQAYAQGAGPITWRQLTASIYGKLFRGDPNAMSRACVLHQLHIVETVQSDWPADYSARLVARLDELAGD